MHVLDPGVREPGAAGLEHEAKAGDGTRTRDIQLGNRVQKPLPSPKAPFLQRQRGRRLPEVCRLLHRFLRTSVPIPYGEREHRLSRRQFHGLGSCRLSLLSIPGALITMLVLGRIEYERESRAYPPVGGQTLRPRTPGHYSLSGTPVTTLMVAWPCSALSVGLPTRRSSSSRMAGTSPALARLTSALATARMSSSVTASMRAVRRAATRLA